MKNIKNKINKRKKTAGTWLSIPSETCTEIMAKSGFEWAVIDMEHAPIGIEKAARLIRIATLCGIPAFCRLPENNAVCAKNVLDAGASGIIVPMVESESDAKKAVDSAFYPPAGSRGVGLWRAQGYGNNFNYYNDIIQKNITVIAMVESVKGVENVNKIATTSGIDGIFVGPYDLSCSCGKTGQLEHPAVMQAIEEVSSAAERSGIGCGIHVVHPTQDSIKKAIDQNFTFLAIGTDMIFLDESVRSSATLVLKLFDK